MRGGASGAARSKSAERSLPRGIVRKVDFRGGFDCHNDFILDVGSKFRAVGIDTVRRRIAFIIAIAVLSNVILAVALPRVDEWATEITRIAASIASGHGFSSPFASPTGPSAWIPPVYPYLLAGIFRVFGEFTRTSYWVANGLNIVVHALTCVVLYRAAGEAFGPRAGWYAANALAIFPLLFYPLVLLRVLSNQPGHGLFVPPNVIWYTHLSELAIVLLIWLTLRPPHWAVYGMAWGVVGLLNPTVLTLMPPFLVWRLRAGERLRYLGLAAATAAFCVTPWLVRNYRVFDRPIFIRDNFGVELRAGNQLGQYGLWSGEVHPDRNPYELRLLTTMGEADYCAFAGQQALHFIRSHPGEFVRDTILRVRYWWFGNPESSRKFPGLVCVKYVPLSTFSILALWGVARALWRKNQKAELFVAVLLFYPLIYYVTHTFFGLLYQYPIQPEMLALAIAGLIRNEPTDGVKPPAEAHGSAKLETGHAKLLSRGLPA